MYVMYTCMYGIICAHMGRRVNIIQIGNLYDAYTCINQNNLHWHTHILSSIHLYIGNLYTCIHNNLYMKIPYLYLCIFISLNVHVYLYLVSISVYIYISLIM